MLMSAELPYYICNDPTNSKAPKRTGGSTTAGNTRAEPHNLGWLQAHFIKYGVAMPETCSDSECHVGENSCQSCQNCPVLFSVAERHED